MHNPKKPHPNLNPIATRAPLCTCKAVTWGKRSSPWGSPWSIWPNSKLLSCPEEVWWRWQPSLRPWSPAVPPPGCFSYLRIRSELQHDTQIPTSEGETVTQTISHPPSIPYQAGLGDLAAAAGKDHGRERCKPKSQGNFAGQKSSSLPKKRRKKTRLSSHTVLKQSPTAFGSRGRAPSAGGSQGRG